MGVADASGQHIVWRLRATMPSRPPSSSTRASAYCFAFSRVAASAVFGLTYSPRSTAIFA